jgi:molybdenum cofactor cytidylyltransferase
VAFEERSRRTGKQSNGYFMNACPSTTLRSAQGSDTLVNIKMKISAIILAAGQSKRMGQPKMLLPWGKTTVLGQVIETVQRAGVDDILVVTGGVQDEIMRIVTQYSIRSTHNPDYASGEMLSSLQTGLRTLTLPPPSLRDTSPIFCENGGGREGGTALICLGDQPQVQEGSVRAVVSRFIETGASLVVPSFQMRRGHPWLVARPLWDEILQMKSPQSPRDFLNRHASEIEYVEVDNPSILADLDTFEDYLKSRP